ncbi:hypothetical protein Drorol1_Dr00018093 [Drosera rotundifolia]
MCSSKPNTNTHHNSSSSTDMDQPSSVARINGRPVLQPTCNRLLRRHNHPITTTTTATKPVTRAPKLSPSPPISPTPISPPITRPRTTPSASPPSSALAGKLQVADMRKLRIAHYGRRTKGSDDKARVRPEPMDSSLGTRMEKRCNFITPSSDPIYVTYHDEEWGVPVHDDNLLFELLVLTTAQIGSEWTSILKRRELLRDAFSGFSIETVATFSERRVASISCNYGIELSQVRGAVENAKQILKIKEEYGSFDKYLWQYVNFKPIATQYRTCQKIPVKTSKSDAISKDLVKRGFRFVGPAVIHSFMQAVGLTNDHIVSCPRHLHCSQLA